MVWRADDPQGNEAAKIKWEIVEYTRGRGLDLGCGPFKTFPHFIGVDNCDHAQQFGWNIKPDVHVSTCEDLGLFASQSMDFVFSSHLLEHIQDYQSALKEWWRVIKPGGYLILYLPHKGLYPNIGDPHANPDHKHDFEPCDIIVPMREMGGFDLIRNEDRNEECEYSFFQVYKKLKADKIKLSYRDPKPNKTCAVVRYGAFGDLIQASSIFPGLKAQGYHITLYTIPSGYEVVKHDPHLDKVILQDRDQIPNEQLNQFWAVLAKKYDKLINLSESVEGTLLPIPGRANHAWPDEVRRKRLNVNYLEFTHELAGVPFKMNAKFYPTDQEKEWAKTEYKKMGGYVILWSLAGSAVHKTWPYLDTIVARLMQYHPDTKVVMVGDALCQMLEHDWRNEPRVFRRSGIWSIRESLSFAQQADLVIGPETGVLNAVGAASVPKIVTLSHSSHENLTKHWTNTTVLKPTTSCYPCHRMHYSFEFCRRDEVTGVAQCQADIGPDEMYSAIVEIMKKAA